MKKRKNKKATTFNYLYWLLPFLITIFQGIYTFASLDNIGVEELITSIRSPFWLQHGLIFNGAFSDVGWYGLLLFIYNFLGFDINTAKFVRLILGLISMLCLAGILKKYLGEKNAWLPLLVIGLSPTLLYFNQFQVQYGIDLQIFPVILYLIVSLNYKQKFDLYLKQGLIGFLTMWAWLAYPVFIYYLPILGFLYFRSLLQGFGAKVTLKHIKVVAVSLVSFLTPLIVAIIFIKNRNLLFFDPLVGRGIFRGNGFLTFDWTIFSDNAQLLLIDLFTKPVSYYYIQSKAEFSDYYPLITVFFVLVGSLMVIRQVKKLKIAVSLLLIYLIVVFIAVNLTGETGGLRRATVILAIFYALFSIVWGYRDLFKLNKTLTALPFLLILMHHLITFPINLDHMIKNPNFRSSPLWYQNASTPAQSLKSYLDILTKSDLVLACNDPSGKPQQCSNDPSQGYTLIYPVLQGYCLWNNVRCHTIYYFSDQKQQAAPLTLEYWDYSNKGF